MSIDPEPVADKVPVFGGVNKVTVFNSRKINFTNMKRGFVVATTDSKVLDFNLLIARSYYKLLGDEKVSVENLEKILLDTKLLLKKLSTSFS